MLYLRGFDLTITHYFKKFDILWLGLKGHNITAQVGAKRRPG